MLRSVDFFSAAQVVRALRAIAVSDKALVMLQAHAATPNRAMSRLELARSVGRVSVNVSNSVYGTLATKLAMAIDPTLRSEWKPERGPQSDFVMFLNRAPRRWTSPSEGENDPWVFVMRDTFARALDELGIAAYTPLDPALERALTDGSTNDDESDPLDPPPSIAAFDIDDAEGELESLMETEREAVILARLGQGIFRDELLAMWDGQCSVTGSKVKAALVASHIKPWRDSSNDERLNRFNGVLLTGTLDRLFDAGLITFEGDGYVRISRHLPRSECEILHVSPSMRLRMVAPQHAEFLAYHRENIFVDA